MGILEIIIIVIVILAKRGFFGESRLRQGARAISPPPALKTSKGYITNQQVAVGVKNGLDPLPAPRHRVAALLQQQARP